jgi:hypothetical protein
MAKQKGLTTEQLLDQQFRAAAMPSSDEEDFWAMSLVIDDPTKPTWDCRISATGTWEQCIKMLAQKFDSMMPIKQPVRFELFQGKKALAYLRECEQQEARYQQEGLTSDSN